MFTSRKEEQYEEGVGYSTIKSMHPHTWGDVRVHFRRYDQKDHRCSWVLKEQEWCTPFAYHRRWQ